MHVLILVLLQLFNQMKATPNGFQNVGGQMGFKCGDSVYTAMPDNIRSEVVIDNRVISVELIKTDIYPAIPLYEVKGNNALIRHFSRLNMAAFYSSKDLMASVKVEMTCDEAGNSKYLMEGYLAVNGTAYIIAQDNRTTSWLSKQGSRIASVMSSYPAEHISHEKGGLAGGQRYHNNNNSSKGSMFNQGHIHQRFLMSETYEVELLVVVDYSLFSHFYNLTDASLSTTERNKNAKHNIQKYIGLVMTSVNLIYKSLGDYSLTVKVIPVSILIFTDVTNAPWNEKASDFMTTFGDDGQHRLDGDKILDDFAAFVNGRSSVPKPDHAVLFTMHDVDRKNETHENDTQIEGIAALGAICGVRSVSVVTDKFLDFTFVFTFAHELGHSLGAEHDETGNDCPKSVGNVMTPTIHHYTVKEWIFSTCSVDYFKRQIAKLNRNHDNCLERRNYQRPAPELAEYLNQWYGQVYTADEQCVYKMNSDESYFSRNNFNETVPYKKICLEMDCIVPSNDTYTEGMEAADGTICGKNKWCMAGHCVSSPIPFNVSDDCPQGDIPFEVKLNMNCSELVNKRPQECYKTYVNRSCCTECSKVKPFNAATVDLNTIPSANQQCIQVLGKDSYFCKGLDDYNASYTSVCEDMYCYNVTSDLCHSVIAADGTPCGYKKWCEKMKCVTSPRANILPDDCTFGNRRTWCEPSLAEQAGSSYCYDAKNRHTCCATCARIRNDSLAAGCEYGDRAKWCQGFIPNASQRYKCFYGNNAHSCCDTCFKYRDESATAACPYGNTNIAVKYNMTCVELVHKRPQDCYHVNKSCCSACSKVKPFDPATTNVSVIPSTDEQCIGIFGEDSYFCRNTDTYTSSFAPICSELYCYNKTDDLCYYVFAADGTPCGNKKWCVAGQCLQNENAMHIPDPCQVSDSTNIVRHGMRCPELIRKRPQECYESYVKGKCCVACSGVTPFNPDSVNLQSIPSADEQCLGIFGNDTYFCRHASPYSVSYSAMCSRLDCYNRTDDLCYHVIAADGTNCGDQQWCVAGKCVSSPHASRIPNQCKIIDSTVVIQYGMKCPELIRKRPQDCYESYVKGKCCVACNQATPFNPDTVPLDTIPSADEQCKSALGNDSYFCMNSNVYSTSYTSVCSKMFCYNNTDDLCYSVTAADGTPCGNKHWCEGGTCVSNQRAPSRADDCMFGDRRTWCNSTISAPSGGRYCYDADNLHNCCYSCATLRTDSNGCEYGDHSSQCVRSKCNTYSEDSRRNLCCKTCS